MQLPTGTITFLFSDTEGSTKLWEQHSEAMRVAVARHDTLLRGAFTAAWEEGRALTWEQSVAVALGESDAGMPIRGSIEPADSGRGQ